MCRHAAYAGPPVGLNEFLLRPSHSLVEQSYRPREMLGATVNVDGFGIGWYLDDGRPGLYTNPMPIWSDSNLEHLGAALASPMWIGNVRSATRGQPVNQANTHPFLVGDYLFSHNGYIHNFFESAHRALRSLLEPEHESPIRGSTDSEHVFALLRQEIAVAGDMTDAFGRLFERLETILTGTYGLFNLLIADGRRVYATRHAIGYDSPSLYIGTDRDLFDGGWLVASEPLTEATDWQKVPDHHLVVIEDGHEPQVTPL